LCLVLLGDGLVGSFELVLQNLFMIFSFIERFRQLGVLIFERVIVQRIGFDLVVQSVHVFFECLVFHLKVGRG
jgi:hypothetical protein